jgi:small subunit ribosomal protein S9
MVATKKDTISGHSLGTGRRKSAIARVRITAGSGKITVNDREFTQYFPIVQHQAIVLDALETTNHRQDVDVIVRVTGGGPHGQAGAVKMGIARALCAHDGETFNAMRGGGYLTRDSRMKERKHYGLRGARRGTQFSKR